MALSVFADKSEEPGADELRRILGRTHPHWEELIRHLAAEQAPLDTAWNFAGAKWGWSLRLRRKKRTVLYLTPCRSHFVVGLVLGHRAVAAAHDSALPGPILALIDGARQYAEGRALRLEIRRKRDLEVAKKLAAIKMAS